MADERAEQTVVANENVVAEQDGKPASVSVAVVDSQGVVQKVIEVQDPDGVPEGVLPVSTQGNQ